MSFTDVLLALVPIAITGLGALFVWGQSKAVKAVAGTQADQKTGGALSRLLTLVFLFVRRLNDTTKKEILAARDPDSPGGAKITPEEGKLLRDQIIEDLKNIYGYSPLTKIKYLLGAGSEEVVEKLILAQIENSVSILKSEQVRVAAVSGVPKQ